jgi:hypothetical protein
VEPSFFFQFTSVGDRRSLHVSNSQPKPTSPLKHLTKERHPPHVGETTERFKLQLNATLKAFQVEQSELGEFNQPLGYVPTSNHRVNISCSMKKGLVSQIDATANGVMGESDNEKMSDEDSINSDLSSSNR